MKNTYRLYGRQNSGSFAVQVALEEAGASYENHWIGKDPTEVQKYRVVNPTGKVPSLALPDGTTMFESAAMLIHLALEYPQKGLGPDPESSAHALFLQWMVFLSANLYESALRMYYPERYSSGGAAHADAVKQQAATDFLQHMTVINQALNPYVLGETYSIADVYLYMLGTWYVGERAELLAKFPRLAAHAALIAKRPAVIKVEAAHA
jgi:glutathione S-transferase